MAEISKPDYSYVWASGGAVIAPNLVKIQTGWTAEVPPFQWENYIQNRQDNMLVHINQHGIPQWDALTEYFGGKSYTLGSDGIIYKAVANSSPSTTTQDPTTDVTGTYWTVAFATPGSFLTQATADTRYLQKANNFSDVPNIVTARTNLSVYSKLESNDLFSQTGVVGVFSNLKISATGTTSLVNVTADELVVKNYTNNRTRILRSVAVTPNTSVSGDGGIDTGSSTSNTWYAVWVIYNETSNTQSVILSLSSTSPTMPAGYTYRARVGWIRTDNTANKYPLSFIQAGEWVTYRPAAGSNVPNYPIIATGAQGTTTALVPVSVTAFVPSSATEIKLQIIGATNSNTMAAPSAAFTGGISGPNSPPLNNTGSTGTSSNLQGSFLLESTNVYYYGLAAASYLQCVGWRDNL